MTQHRNIIIDFVRSNKLGSLEELAKKLGISRQAVHQQLKRLHKEGLINMDRIPSYFNKAPLYDEMPIERTRPELIKRK